MAIYLPPSMVTDADLEVLDAIDGLRRDLRFYLAEPRRWLGTLRRTTFARVVQGSNSIEGYHASVEDVAAVIDGDDPLATDLETRHAIEGYRDAMTYVLQLAPTGVAVDATLVRSLHFMIMKYDLGKNPGLWRPGAVWIRDEHGDVVYEAPDREQVDDLVSETLAWVNHDSGPVMIRAAMAHLNLTLIHPFSDGNGRMARCLQSLVLASTGLIPPVFSSIEEYLGANSSAYYEALTAVSHGRWSPDRDTQPWITFTLTAHHHQARTLLRRVHETEALWDACEQLARRHRLPGRTVSALCDAARGWRLRRSLYARSVLDSTGEPITDPTATRDLKMLTDAGLLLAQGEKRGRHYAGTPELRATWERIQQQRSPAPTPRSAR